MNSLKFSIITICYNNEKDISKTLDSVINQTYKNFEYIIIDGKSTDGTLSIVEKYKDHFDGNLTIISEKDNGIYDAYNKGIQYSVGDIVGLINAGDWYEPNALEIIAAFYQNSGLEVIYGMQREYLGENEKICYLKRHEFLQTQMIGFPATFITKKVYKKFGLFDTKYKSAGDLDFLLKVFNSGEANFIPVYRPVANFKLGGISGSNEAMIEVANIRYKYGIISKSKRNQLVLDQRIRLNVKKILNRIGLRRFR